MTGIHNDWKYFVRLAEAAPLGLTSLRRDEPRGIVVRFPAGTRYFSLLQSVTIYPGPTQPHVQ
jgi:hypothetical protein